MTLSIEVKQTIINILSQKNIRQSNVGPAPEGKYYYCDGKKIEKRKRNVKVMNIL